MADARLKTELTEAKAEIQRLKDRISAGTPTVHIELSLITLVSKWTGSDAAVTLEEFLSSNETSARIGRWKEADKLEIALLKLAGPAKTFYVYKGVPNFTRTV